jgi:hypothetical protein
MLDMISYPANTENRYAYQLTAVISQLRNPEKDKVIT